MKTRKILMISLILLLILAFFSCNSEENGEVGTTLSTEAPTAPTDTEISTDTEDNSDVPSDKAVYTVLEAGMGTVPSSRFGTNHKLEYETVYENYEDENAVKKIKITYNGKLYDAKYLWTAKRDFYNSHSYVYEAEDNRITFAINVQTGEIVEYENIVYSDETTKTKEECIEIAKNWLKTHTDDASEYTLFDDYGFRSNAYAFQFARVINGIRTTDHAQIFVSYSGEIICFSLKNFGIMDNIDFPTDDQIADVQRSVDIKLDEIYGNINDGYTVTIDESEMYFTRFFDGRYGFEYVIKVSLAKGDSVWQETTELVVFID